MSNNYKFSLGLYYNTISDFSQDDLYRFLNVASREEIIDWLQWNDPNGVYRDEQSMAEFGKIVPREEGIEIVMRQIRES